MSLTLRDALIRLTVAELKELVRYLPGAETTGRKDQLLERIIGGMLGPALNAIWSGLDETQQAAVAEAVYHPLGEYSEQRFRAKYQRVPSFQVVSGTIYEGLTAIDKDLRVQPGLAPSWKCIPGRSLSLVNWFAT